MVVSPGIDAIHDNVATKQDLENLRLELKADIAAVAHRLITRLGGLVLWSRVSCSQRCTIGHRTAELYGRTPVNLYRSNWRRISVDSDP